MENISKTLLIDIYVTKGTMENVQIGANCNPEEIASFTCLFKEFRDAFTWSHEEIPTINLSIVVHEIQLYDDAKPIKCQIPSLQIAIEPLPDTTAKEECLIYVNHLDETHRDVELALEA